MRSAMTASRHGEPGHGATGDKRLGFRLQIWNSTWTLVWCAYSSTVVQGESQLGPSLAAGISARARLKHRRPAIGLASPPGGCASAPARGPGILRRRRPEISAPRSGAQSRQTNVVDLRPEATFIFALFLAPLPLALSLPSETEISSCSRLATLLVVVSQVA